MKHITLLLALCLLIVSFAGCQSTPGLTLETKPPEEQADPTPGAPSPEKPGTEEGNENEENKENNENEENKKDPDPNAGVKLDKASLSLLVGEGAVLVATCTHPYPDTVCDLHYSISHESIAHIDQNGAVTAKQAGSATITATCGEYSASCALTVSRKENENAGIHVSNQSIDLRVGASQGLGATLTPKYEGDDTTITYKTDNASVASVSESGLVTAIGKGSCTITLTGGGFTLQIAVTVRAKTSENSFSFLAAGDNLLHSGIYNDARLRAGGSGYDFSGIYKAIADKVKNADFSMINQETVFTGASPSSYPSLNAPQQAVKALADLGFDIISLANNHCLDKGGDGLAKSMTYLDSLKTVIRLGGYFKKNNDALKIRVIEKNGIKVALLAYTTFTNGDIPSDYNSSGVYVPWAVEENIADDIARAKTKADAILVFMHWGDEEQFEITDKQAKMAQFLADNGVDIIIGAHPHVIQPVKMITAKDGKTVPCVYSLGTLVSNMATEQNMLSCLVSFDFVKDESGKIYVENLVMDPYVFYYDMEYRQSALYRITDFTDSLAKSHGVGNYPKESATKNTVSLKRLYGYLSTYIDAEYLPSDVLSQINNYK